MRRAERAAQVRELRDQGLTQKEVAERLGISRSYVSGIDVDPTGSLDMARKNSYRGTCEKCGAPTDGSNGPGKAPRFCSHCWSGEHQLIWTRERVVDAIREFARRNGRPPTSTEWITRTVTEDGYVFPPRSAVYDNQNGNRFKPFDRWADAIEAAGFPRPNPGTKRPKEKIDMPANGQLTRTYIVFSVNPDHSLTIVGETEASTNQEAIENTVTDAGRYACVPKGSLQTFTLQPRLVATRDGKR